MKNLDNTFSGKSLRKRAGLLAVLVIAFMALSVSTAHAENRFIVRTSGLTTLQTVCRLLGCTVKYGIDGTLGKVFLVTTPDSIDPTRFLATLLKQVGIVSAEKDVLGRITGSSGGSAIPSGLWDKHPVDYYGATVWRGYVTQPASTIVGVADTQNAFGVDGAGIVAVIDTGVDPNHPALKNSLLPGYDFTRNKDGGSEMSDINQSYAAVVDNSYPTWVNQSYAAVVDQSYAAVVDNPAYAAFGHGTMVAGVVHLVAPRAMIMPLKAFRADGGGYTSDVLRAIYKAVQSNAKILSMSFSFAAPSQELSQAMTYANKNGVISVAAAGNDGRKTLVYPAAYADRVMGIASTTNADVRSTFSNYGSALVWVAAPGEGIITTYPFGTYAAAWGTSFSAPFVSGGAALLLDVKASCNEAQGAQALGKAKKLTDDLGNGRLDLYRAVLSWRQTAGL